MSPPKSPAPADNRANRRAFLQRSGGLLLGGAALPFGINLMALRDAAAFGATDYKALVCVFLQGGNDHDNTVVPYDSDSYDRYHLIRAGSTGQEAGGIALARSALTATALDPTTALPNGRRYALHPSLAGLAGLFHGGQAAVLLNVGPLVVPMTRAQYDSANLRDFPQPPKLFSHNDQQSIWQAASPEGATVGLGGKIADAAIANNAYSLMSSIAVADDGTTGVFLAGDQAIPYQLTSAGAVHIDALDEGLLKGPMRAAFARMTQQPRAHLLENEYNRVMARAVAAESRVNAALNAVTLNTAFPSGSLAAKLKMVAKVIATRTAFDTRRQVFFVSLANFDLHDGLIARHPAVLRQVNDALVAFYNATVELGVANQVTAFTASDFGRTLSSNGDGSDHGWGGHHFIVGGAVKGRAFYGTPPPLSISDSSAADDQWHVGQGRLLPSTSVDQYAATLARWFGVSEAEMPNVVPNLRRFGAAAGRPDYPTDLGFMA